jgi:hypothetical protein
MATRLLKSYLPVEAITPTCISLGKAAGYRLEVERMHRVLARIVRGLYFHETKRRVTDEMAVYTSFEPPAARERAVVHGLLAVGEKSIARGGFRYWLGPHPKAPATVACPMVFFDGLLAIGRVESHA